MEMLLVRHARPLRAESIDGPADPGLSPLGRRQADALAAWLAPEAIDAIYTSPLRRALETAAPLAIALGVDPVPEPALAEYDADAMAYIPIEELKAAGDPRWMALPDDIAGFQGRVVNVVVAAVLGLGPRMVFLPAYTSITRVLVASSGQRSLATLNETAHLRVADVPLVEH